MLQQLNDTEARARLLSRIQQSRAAFLAVRFVVYGMIGLGGEVLFYNLVRLGRLIPVVEMLFQFGWHVDERLHLDAVWHTPMVALYGQASVWMFFVYGVACVGVVEPIFRRFAHRTAFERAVAYGVGILLFEVLSGLVLFRLTGYRIWFYDDRLAVLGMSSFAIFPVWMGLGIVAELLFLLLVAPELRGVRAPQEARATLSAASR